MTERLHFHFSLSCTGERNGNPLQRSCLENPRDWGAWWAAVYGIAQSRTRLSDLAVAAVVVAISETRFLSQAWLITQHCCTYFFAQIVPALFSESSFRWLLFPVAISLSFGDFFKHVLFSYTARCSLLLLYISCTDLRVSHFSKEPWWLLLKIVVGTVAWERWLIAPGVSLLLSLLS